MMYKILLVDDSEAFCKTVKLELKKRDFQIRFETDADKTIETTKSFVPDLILLDIMWSDENKGQPTYKKLRDQKINTPVIILTTTLNNMDFNTKDYPGASFHYPKEALQITNPASYDQFAQVITEQIEKKYDVEINREKFGFVVGATEKMHSVCKTILKVAKLPATVLITGETGTGKELVANGIHKLSGRKGKMVKINCSAVPEGLIESKMFGTEKGAYPDAVSRNGLFEEAEDGTIFLDEIGTLGNRGQEKLLRAIEQKEFYRVGGKTKIETNARIISATNDNLDQAVSEEKFRIDLLARLKVVLIDLPPLRERKEDIPELYVWLVNELNNHRSIQFQSTLRENVLNKLKKWDWPENIRELKHTIERAMVNAKSLILFPDDFQFRPTTNKENQYIEETIINKMIDGSLKWDYFKDKKKFKYPLVGDDMEQIWRNFIKEWKIINGRNPTSPEISVHLNLKENTLRQNLKKNGINLRELKKSPNSLT